MITLQNISFQGTKTPQKKGIRQATPAQPITKAKIESREKSPSAASLKAFYLPTASIKKPRSIHFAGGPSSAEITGIVNSLSGWKNDENVIGPNYFPEPTVANALLESVAEHRDLSAAMLEKIAQHKARVQNIHNLLLNKPAVTATSFQEETLQFANEYKTRLTQLNNFLTAEGIPSIAIHLFNQYASYTAPIMFAMGFPDAVAHAADVAQLTYLRAKKVGASQADAVQALFVGWLHDPKLPGAISWSNLATHPAIASSIALHTLSQPEINATLEHYSENPVLFREGIKDALAINNDSAWVMNNVILHKSAFSPMSERGLADTQPENPHAETPRHIEELFNARFEAPSQSTSLPPISDSLMEAMNQVELSTDLRGLRYDAFSEEYKRTITREALTNLLDGKAENSELWTRTQQLIAEQPSRFVVNPKVKGGTLSCHHMEVENAPFAARALAEADPLLLSPHKVIAQTSGTTMIARLASFITSFDNNICFLPRSAQEDGKAWRNHLMIAMLGAAQELTGNSLLEDETAIGMLIYNDEALKKKVLDPATWQGPKGNYDSAAPGSADFTKVLSALKTSYEMAVNEVLMKTASKKHEEPLLPTICSSAFNRPSGVVRLLNAQGTFRESSSSGSALFKEVAK